MSHAIKLEPLDVDFQYDAPDWAYDRCSKRAIIFHARQSREFLGGAVQLLAAGEESTARTALDMAAEALAEAVRLLEPRLPEEDQGAHSMRLIF